MAAVLTGQPWHFDGTTQVDIVGHPIYVRYIVIKTAATAGDAEVLTAASGLSITGTVAMGVDDRFVHPVWGFVKGIYIESLPSGATIEVFHGRDG